MPGITAWFPLRADPRHAARFGVAQRLMVRKPADSAVVDVEGPRALIGHVSAPAYPVRTWAEPTFTVVFEGHAYGRSEPELRRVVVDLFRRAFSTSDPLRVVSEFVRATEGDFLALAATQDRCIVFSDALGRLPLYVHEGQSGLVLARECKFIAAIRGAWSFDRKGLAEHFWLGYPIGNRTLFEGIERASEGFFLDVRIGTATVEAARARTYLLRCDAQSDARGIDDSAAGLAALFVRAAKTCTDVEPELPPVVSLSGGHDSRSVLAAAKRARPDCIAATFRRSRGGQAGDVRIAEQVARSLGVQWECVELPEHGIEAEERLVWMKDGLNHTGMAFIVAFFDELVRRFGERAVLLTGDGGDKVFPDLRPVRQTRTLDALVEIIVDEHALMPASEVELCLNLPPGALIEELRSRLESYPEDSCEHKAVHWKIAERSRKWLFEGEDRNRCFLWQASPCLALSVFEAAMRVPDAQKTDMRLYLKLQQHLDPALVTMPHADTGLSIDSPQFRARAFARRWGLRAAGPLRRSIVRHVRATEAQPTTQRVDTLLRLEAASRGGSALMQVLQGEHWRSNVARATRAGLHNWRTVLLLDRLWSERIAGPA